MMLLLCGRLIRKALEGCQASDYRIHLKSCSDCVVVLQEVLKVKSSNLAFFFVCVVAALILHLLPISKCSFLAVKPEIRLTGCHDIKSGKIKEYKSCALFIYLFIFFCIVNEVHLYFASPEMRKRLQSDGRGAPEALRETDASRLESTVNQRQLSYGFIT